MKNRNLYALMVGINTYPSAGNVNPLIGAVHDINRMDKLLNTHLPNEIACHSKLLVNHEATRERIIREFRSHLGKASGNDIVLFMFCGHGSRQDSDPLFHQFYPDGKDETLVCYNSRLEGGMDLADKELAVLIDEVVKEDVHCLIILDCCHAGSGTRTLDDFKKYVARTAPKAAGARDLSTYLDGFYSEMLTKAGKITVPSPRHLLLAASNRHQNAYEHFGGWGVFSDALANILEKKRFQTSYKDLYRICRQLIMANSSRQTPQFESRKGINANGGFLDMFSSGREVNYRDRLPLRREAGVYYIDLGVLHGLNPEAPEHYGISLFRENSKDVFGEGTLLAIGLERSVVGFLGNFVMEKGILFEVAFSGFAMPISTLLYDGPVSIQTQLRKIFPSGYLLETQPKGYQDQFGLRCRGQYLHLVHLPSQRSIVYGDIELPGILPVLVDNLRQIKLWQKFLGLVETPRILAFPEVDIEFRFSENQVESKVPPGGNIEIVVPSGDFQSEVFPSFKVRNQGNEPVFFTLFYLSQDFGIHFLFENEIQPGPRWVDFWGQRETDYFFVPDNILCGFDTFIMIASDYQLDYAGLLFGDISGGEIFAHRKIQSPVLPPLQWSIFGAQFLLFENLGTFGNELFVVGNGIISILPSSGVTGTVSLGGSHSPAIINHPMQFGPDLLQQMGGDGTLLSMGKAGNWDADVLRISNLSGISPSGDGSIQFQLNPGNVGRVSRIWCVGFGGESIELLADKWIEEAEPARFFINPTNRQVGILWIWFFSVEPHLKPQQFPSLSRFE